jgi:hypothetical protein
VPAHYPRYDPNTKTNTAGGSSDYSGKQRTFPALGIAIMLAVNAHGGTTLAAARLGALDVTGAAKFCQSAFGMHEVTRLDMPGIKEIMLNFGDSVEAAKANTNASISGDHANYIFALSECEARERVHGTCD